MEKAKMHSLDIVNENIKNVGTLFPECVTETIDENGEKKFKIDFEKLQENLSHATIGENEERYQFTWPGKREAIHNANAPTNMTLRPCKEESVDFENTQNLYIEGDNLEVLKLLQENYLGKVKMIYIDPPYNTGNDFVYNDSFKEDLETFQTKSGMYDEEGNMLLQNYEKNNESNGRFHSDWLNMIYPRLKIARNLLSDNGVIFISIDDNEYCNLKKICDEIFGASNAIGPIVQNKLNSKNDTVNVQKNHEFVLIYRKSATYLGNKVLPTLLRTVESFKDVLEENGRYFYLNDSITTRGEGGTLNARQNLGYTVYYNPNTKDKQPRQDYDVALAKTCNDESVLYHDDEDLIKKGYVKIRPPKVRGKLGCWTWEMKKFEQQKDEVYITGKPGAYAVHKRTFVNFDDVVMQNGKKQVALKSLANSRSILDYSTNDGTNELTDLFGVSGYFDNPKNVNMLEYFIQIATNPNNPVAKDDVKPITILDFFSGSATTAHAVLNANISDKIERRFICVQLPERIDETRDSFKAGYETICDLGKERIRKVGEKIKSQYANQFDVGFRVLKLAESNMKDVYYAPSETYDASLFDANNVKEDRTSLDLLFQVMPECNLPLSSKIEEKQINGKTVYFVNGNYLVACFDEGVSDDLIESVAKEQPYFFYMRNAGLSSDKVLDNFEQLFARYSPTTKRKVI